MAALRFSIVSGLVSETRVAKPEKHKGMHFEIYPDWFESRDHFIRVYQMYLFSNLSAVLWTEP